MSIFNLFKTKGPSLKQGLEFDFSKDFDNQACRCVQQELDLSELTWMDTSSYQHSKKMLKDKSEILMREYLTSDNHKDVFR